MAFARQQFDSWREEISVDNFVATSSFAQIRQIRVPLPRGALSSYNDDVRVTPYKGALDSYMNPRRPNLRIGDLGDSPREGFSEQAMRRQFPLAEIPSIPAYDSPIELFVIQLTG